jgi:hypothetical protein
MLQKEIDRITESSLNSIRGFGAGASYSQIAPKLHPAILRHISSSIEDKIMEERKNLMYNSSFDYSSGEVAQYYELISKTVKRSKVFELAFYEQLIRESAAFNVYLLSNPQKTFSQVIFHDDSSKEVTEIEKTLSNVYYYDYIKKIILAYARKKNLHYFDYQDFKTFIGKAYKELLGAYPRTILDGTITAIGDFSAVAGGEGSRIPKDMLVMFLESNYLPDLAEKIKFNAGDSEDIRPSDAQRTVHEFFKKDEKGYNLLKTDFVPSEPAFIPLRQPAKPAEIPNEEVLRAALKSRKAINFNPELAEPIKTAPVKEETKAPEAIHLVSEEIAETLIPKEKIDETFEPAETNIAKADKVETETAKPTIEEAVKETEAEIPPAKEEQPAGIPASKEEEPVEILEFEPEAEPLIIEEEEPASIAEAPPAVENMPIEMESKDGIKPSIPDEKPEEKIEEVKPSEEVKQEEPSITAGEIFEEPMLAEPEVIAPAAIPEAVKEEKKAPEPPQAKVPPVRQAPPQQRRPEPRKTEAQNAVSETDRIANEFILDEIINDDLASVKRTNKPAAPKEEEIPDHAQANTDLGAIMMKNIIGVDAADAEPQEDRTINKSTQVSGERDILSYMDNKSISRLVDDVFNDDMEELIFLTEQLEKAGSYEEANTLLEKIFKVRKTPQGLKEVEIFKNALKEYYNKKK